MGDEAEKPQGETRYDPETVDQLRRELEHLKERLGRMEKPAK
jgi:ubiquinone biosynthesis protein UbiJ